MTSIHCKNILCKCSNKYQFYRSNFSRFDTTKKIKKVKYEKLITLLLLTVVSTYGQKAEEKLSFTAKIENRNSDSIVIRSRSFSKTIKIDKKGEFKDSFEVTEGFYRFSDGTESSNLYLKNGYDLNLKMNAKEFDESIVFTGKGAKENNYLAQKALIDEQFGMDLEALLDRRRSHF